MPERFLRKNLYLDFTGYKRTSDLMKPFEKEIIPEFETTKGLNMVDASVLTKSQVQSVASQI